MITHQSYTATKKPQLWKKKATTTKEITTAKRGFIEWNKIYIVSDVLADILRVEVDVKSDLHTRCDVTLHRTDGEVGQEAV